MKLPQLKAINIAIRDTVLWYKGFNKVIIFSEKDREILELIILNSLYEQTTPSQQNFDDWARIVKNTIKHLTTE